MEKRRVRFSLPGNSRPQEFESSATTWGELEAEAMDELNFDFENTKVRDFNTNHQYSDAAAILPEGELKLLVSTDKNKSGTINKGNYHKATYSDLRTFCKKITGFGPNGKDLCLSALDKYYGGTTETPKATVKKTVKVAVKAPNVTTSSKSLETRVAALEAEVFGRDAEDRAFLEATKNNA